MSATPSSADAFARVRDALLAVWPTVADAQAGLTKAELGRLLDECGSDHRPLVEVVLDLGRVVRPILATLPPQNGPSWVNSRAPVVHKLVSTRYLQPDVARWAVDVWGQALGVAPATPMTSPTLEGSGTRDAGRDSATTEAARAAGGAATGPSAAPSARASTTARPPVLTPQQIPPAMRQVPSWAGGPVSFGVGQKPRASAMAALAHSGRIVVQGGGPTGPRFQPVEQRAALVLGVLLLLVTGGLLKTFRERAAEGEGGAQVASVDTMKAGAMTAGARTAGAGTAGARTAGATQAPATQAPAAQAPAAQAPAAQAPASQTPASQTPATQVPATQAPVVWADVRAAGVGGRYVVAQQVRDVSGSESCDAVARVLAAGRESEEVVSHIPGHALFTLATRGVTGTLDADGQFVSEPRAGTTNNVNWRFRMSGRFGPDGFTGQSVTYTDAILRWGKIQTCVVTADLTGRRRLN